MWWSAKRQASRWPAASASRLSSRPAGRCTAGPPPTRRHPGQAQPRARRADRARRRMRQGDAVASAASMASPGRRDAALSISAPRRALPRLRRTQFANPRFAGFFSRGDSPPRRPSRAPGGRWSRGAAGGPEPPRREQRQRRQRDQCDHRQKPDLAGVGAFAQRVGQSGDPQQRGEAVQLAPPGRADQPPRVVGQSEHDQPPPGDDPERRPEGLIRAPANGTVMSAIDGCRKPSPRRVTPCTTIATIAVIDSASCVASRSAPRFLSSLVLIEQPGRDRQARGHERDDSGSATRDPEQVWRGVGGHWSDDRGAALEPRRTRVRASSERVAPPRSARAVQAGRRRHRALRHGRRGILRDRRGCGGRRRARVGDRERGTVGGHR